MAVLGGAGSVLGKMFKPANQQSNQNQQLGTPDPIKQLADQQKRFSSFQAGFDSPSGGRDGYSTRKGKLIESLKDRGKYEVKQGGKIYHDESGNETDIATWENQGYVLSEEDQHRLSQQKQTYDIIMKNGEVINRNDEDVQDITLTKTDANGNVVGTKVIKAYGLHGRDAFFSDKASLIKREGIDAAIAAGYSKRAAEKWVTDNLARTAMGKETSGSWNMLLNSIVLENKSLGRIYQLGGGPLTAEGQLQSNLVNKINDYNEAGNEPYTVRLGENIVITKAKVDIANQDTLEVDESEMNKNNVMRKRSLNGVTGNDKFIVTDTRPEHFEVESDVLKESIKSYKDSEGNAVTGSAFSYGEVYMYLTSKGINSPLNAANARDREKAYAMLVELGVISEVQLETLPPDEVEKVYQSAVKIFNEHIVAQSNEYAKGLTQIEKDTLFKWWNDPRVVDMRDQYATIEARKHIAMNDFIKHNAAGKDLMASSDGLFIGDADGTIKTLNGEVIDPNSPGSIDNIVDILASMSTMEERRRWINQNLKGQLTAKGERWFNKMNSSLELVLDDLDKQSKSIRTALGRSELSPSVKNKSFNQHHKEQFAYTSGERYQNVHFDKKSGKFVGEEGVGFTGNPVSQLSVIDKLNTHFHNVEIYSSEANNLNLTSNRFMLRMIEKVKTNPEFAETLKRRLNLSDAELSVLQDNDFTEEDLDRDVGFIKDKKRKGLDERKPVYKIEFQEYGPLDLSYYIGSPKDRESKRIELERKRMLPDILK